ncbi:phage terminase large subunit [Alkalicoccus chagannorensis]
MPFTRYTFPDYAPSWHHHLLASYLDEFVFGDIDRLMVFMPPRYGKSELVSRRLPSFIFGNDPEAQIISASYGSDLASRMNRDVQRIVDSPTYHDLFPQTTLNDSNVRSVANGSYLRNSDIFEIVGHRGTYKSSGVGGAITGMGMTYGIIDDPIKNRQDAESPTIREGIWDWYISTFYTRLEKGGKILITLTRWHEDDLAGRLLEKQDKDPKADQWTVLNLPAIAEEPIHPEDPRKEGEALWPEKYPKEELLKIKATVGSYEWNAMHQQRPAAADGNLFKRPYFRYFTARDGLFYLERPGSTDRKVARDDCYIFQTCDPAGSTKTTADYFVMATWAMTPHHELLLLDVYRDKLEGPDQPELFRQSYQRWYPVLQGVEPANMGLTLYQTLQRTGLPVVELKPDKDKVTRALPMAAKYEAGQVYHPYAAEFVEAFEKELLGFPNGKNDDQVDVTSYAAVVQARIEEMLMTQQDDMIVYDDDVEISPY